MKKIILILICLFGLVGQAWAVTSTFTDTGDHLWGTSGNWDNGVPDATIDAVISTGTTALNLGSTARVCKTLTATGTSGLTVTGSAQMSVSGSVTLDSNVTWNTTGNFYMVAAGTFTTGNAAITCAILGDNTQSGTKTLALGSSTINATGVRFLYSPVVSANTSTINIGSAVINYFGGRDWGNSTLNITISSAGVGRIEDAGTNTFGTVTVIFASNISNPATYFMIDGNLTISGTFTIVGSPGEIRPIIQSKTVGTQRTITADTVVITGSVDFQDIAGAGDGSWDYHTGSVAQIGDCGGNNTTIKSGARTPTTYYAIIGTQNYRQDYNDVWTTVDGGESRVAGGTSVFPLPQDTIIFDDYTWSDTGNTFVFHAYTRTGTVDASGLTEANTLGLPRCVFGDIIYTGSGVTVEDTITIQLIDARLKSESSDTLDINIVPSVPVIHAPSAVSYGGTIRLLHDLVGISTFTLTIGTFDLNGHTLSCTVLSSSNSNARTIQDSAGGGKIVLNGLTGTIFDTTTATNLTISNAPDIEIGDSNNTLTGNVTFMGAGKTFGDFTVKKHAGDFDCIVSGANTFGALTLETPDVTYQYSDIQLPASVTTTITSLVATGTADYTININSSSGAYHTLSDTAGTNTVSYATITYSHAEGGATWISSVDSGNVNGGNNSGWDFSSLLSYKVTISDTNTHSYGLVNCENSGAGIHITGAATLINYTVVSCPDGGIVASESCTIKNTIVKSSGDDITIASGKTVTGSYNLFGDAAKAGSGTYTDVDTKWSTDPLFTSSTDFTLLPNSPAIHAGKRISGVHDTGLSIGYVPVTVPEYWWNNPSIGAYEVTPLVVGSRIIP
jgi:hypothetical protein